MGGNVVDFQREKERRDAERVVCYGVVISHARDGQMTIYVEDVAETMEDRLRVARDLRMAADVLESDAVPIKPNPPRAG